MDPVTDPRMQGECRVKSHSQGKTCHPHGSAPCADFPYCGFECGLSIEFDGKEAAAESVYDLMLLGATCGAPLLLSADGQDAEESFLAGGGLRNRRSGSWHVEIRVFQDAQLYMWYP